MTSTNEHSALNTSQTQESPSKKKDKEEGKQESKLQKIMKSIVEFFKTNVKPLTYGFIGFSAMFAFKYFVYNRFMPITKVQRLISENKVSRVFLGNLLMFCTYSNPQAGGWTYCLSSMYPKMPAEILAHAEYCNTEVSSAIPNEVDIASMLGVGASLFLSYQLLKLIKDQNSFNSKKKQDLDERQKGKTFADIGGCEEAKEAIRDIIDYIRHPEHYAKMGVRMPKGVLLYGPPGTGKTLMAKAAATEAGIPVLYSSGSEFVELYVGLGAKRIRDLFQ